MSTWLLDTDILSHLVRRRPPGPLRRRLSVVPSSRLFTSIPTLMELRTGCRRKKEGGPALWRRIREEILSEMKILPFRPLDALLAGDLRALLDARGEPIGVLDTMIAATALSRDMVLVTGNVRHYERVPGLRIENWLVP